MSTGSLPTSPYTAPSYEDLEAAREHAKTLQSFSTLPVCLYQTLGLPPFSTMASVKAAFRSLAKLSHPDKSHTSNSPALFTLAHQAYRILSDPMTKQTYDTWLQASHRSTTPYLQVPLDDLTESEHAHYHYSCRCGLEIEVTRQDLDQGYTIFECDGCSMKIEIDI